MDYNLYYGVKSNRLLIVSNRAPEFTTAVKNTLPGVFVVRYNYDTSSLDDIISKVDDKMQHRKVKSIAILVHSDETQFYICSTNEKVLNGDSLIDDPGINYFMKSLSDYCHRGSSRLDFFNSRLASSCVRYQLCLALRHLTQCDVGIWPDLMGEEYNGELYFSSADVRPTKTALDGYQRIRTVGKGAFGVATLYRNTNKNNLVVIKQINMLDMTAQERQLALNEAKVLSLLSHPYIISYYGSFEMDGVLMIEMEYADGGTLAEYLIGRNNNLLPERQILEMFLQMSEAIQCIHQRNILHRDLKTTNVFLTKKRQIKLGDFGISKIMTTKLQALTVVGTPYYISPEMCEGKQYDQKSDIWALGCILYEMASLQRTFDASNLPALIHFITKEHFAPIPLCYSLNLKKLVNDLLQKDPLRRPDANYLVETVPDFIDFITDSNWVQESSELESSNDDLLNRSVVYQFSSPTNLTPVQLPFRVQIVQLAVSQTHFVALTSDYSIFTWGEDKHGQLGHGEETPWKNDPQCVVSLLDKHITQVGAGHNFSVFVSSTGLVMTTGDGKYGALGHGDWNSVSRPKLIDFLLKVDVVKISCGNYHLAALTNEGQLYTWGRGNHGQLGLGNLQDCCFPILVNWHLDEKIGSIKCGPECTAVITDCQNVYACGLNKCNKLGLNRPSLFKLKFKEVPFESLFTKVKFLDGLRVTYVCFGECHSAAITAQGHVVIWGSNIYSQRGKLRVSQNKPNLLQLPGYSKAQIIDCGPTYTLIGTDDNAVVFCGTRFSMDTKALTQMTSMFTSEVIAQPKVILGLYATDEQIDKGQLLVLNSLQAVGHNLMITVDTFLRVNS
ncbi:serine/threonine-protein kinase Nek8 [Acyrthosiphon pisum]|uniref:non-specific serine/threonine protein kinase n=1 Tax=Acyrthosiphon pisum TaxID=7029 RepID=A0A8R2A6C3_ACYPI|nr:serine/threonine-protein kinase Nek8 [Acyrthosiphon pisum]|eukprot:XP_001946936.3 PREDICTED: serine/threonine-protein kinase Nek8 [Acyrthosiphon pisum]